MHAVFALEAHFPKIFANNKFISVTCCALLKIVVVVVGFFGPEELSACHCVTATLAEPIRYSSQNSPVVPTSTAVAPKNADIETKLLDWHHSTGNSRLYTFLLYWESF